MREFDQPVKEYWVTCELGENLYQFRVLATNSDNAYSIINRDTDWDFITVRKISDKVVGMAQFCARNVTNENPEVYLNYHCKPV